MPYTINNRNGDQITILDAQVNNDLSLALVGRNTQNFGHYFAQNFVDLLDNFATTNTPPARATDGQLWYDKTYKILRSYDSGTSGWKPLAPILTDANSPPNDHGQNTEGALYFDRNTQQLFIYDGTSSQYIRTNIPGEVTNNYVGETNIGSPNIYGTRIRNIYLVDSNGDHRSVLAVTSINDSMTSSTRLNGERIIGIFSEHPRFTVADSNAQSESANINYYDELNSSDGIGTTIRPGLNMRSNNESTVELSNLSERSNVAFGLNTGSYGALGSNISASSIYHANASLIPSNSSTNLGNTTNIFDNLYVSDIILGDGINSSTISINGNTTANIGSATNPINNSFFENITINTSVNIASGLDIGSATNYLGDIYADELNSNTVTVSNYSLPTSDPGNGQVLYTSGIAAPFTTFWDNPINNIADITAGDGLQVSTSSGSSLGPNDEIERNVLELSVGAGTGITVNTNDIAVDLSSFTSDDLSEGATNRYATESSIRRAISVNPVSSGDGELSYSDTTGVISYTGPSPSEIRAHFSSQHGIAYDASLGSFGLDNNFFQRHAGNIHKIFNGTSPILYNENTGTISFDSTNADVGSVGGVPGTSLIRSDQNYRTSNNIITTWGTGSTIKMVGTSGDTDISAGRIAYTSGNIVFVGASGNITFTAAGGIVAEDDITAFSDESLKTDILPIEQALNKIQELRGVTYKRIDHETDHRHAGLLAQEVMKVFPEVVTKHDDGKLGIAYGNMISLLIESIKELKQEVDDLRKNTQTI